MQRAFLLAAISAPLLAFVPAQTAPSPLALASPAALSMAPGLARGKTVAISTEDGMDLAATFFAPRKDRAPGVLLIHDAGGDREQFSAIAKRLQKRGFGVMAVDLRGHGESKTKDLDWSKLSKDERPAAWQRSPRDVEAAADWLLSQKSIHSTSLSLVGIGAGCALAARHAEQDENVISLMLLAPKAKDLGFDVEGTLINVEGLATCIMGKRGGDAEAIVEDINASCEPWIEWKAINPKSGSILEDKKTPSKVAEWLASVAMPKKGRK